MGVCTYLSIRAIGLDCGISAAFVVLAATTFGVTLPTAPGYLGSIQIAFTLALAPYGVVRSDAFAASAFFHVFTYAIVTILGLILLKRRGLKLKQLEEQANADDEEIAPGIPSDEPDPSSGEVAPDQA